MVFQHQQVRASIPCYRNFTLDMGRSPGFGSTATYSFALFRLAFAAAPASHLNLARDRNSPVHSTKGTPSGINALRLIVGTRFQVLFHSAPAVLFTFPSRYWFTIGRQEVFSLRRWSSLIPTGFLVSRSTWGIVSESAEFRIRDFHPLRSAFPDHSSTRQICNSM